jgi:hypothetical protein
MEKNHYNKKKIYLSFISTISCILNESDKTNINENYLEYSKIYDDLVNIIGKIDKYISNFLKTEESTKITFQYLPKNCLEKMYKEAKKCYDQLLNENDKNKIHYENIENQKEEVNIAFINEKNIIGEVEFINLISKNFLFYNTQSKFIVISKERKYIIEKETNELNYIYRLTSKICNSNKYVEDYFKENKEKIYYEIIKETKNECVKKNENDDIILYNEFETQQISDFNQLLQNYSNVNEINSNYSLDNENSNEEINFLTTFDNDYSGSNRDLLISYEFFSDKFLDSLMKNEYFMFNKILHCVKKTERILIFFNEKLIIFNKYQSDFQKESENEYLFFENVDNCNVKKIDFESRVLFFYLDKKKEGIIYINFNIIELIYTCEIILLKNINKYDNQDIININSKLFDVKNIGTNYFYLFFVKE